MNSSKTRKVTIPADIMAELDALPDAGKTGVAIEWTPEMDAILMRLMATKCKTAVYKWWRGKYGWGCRDSLRKRYEQLVGQ